MQVTRAREFSVYLQNRPGEMAGVLEAQAAAGAQLMGVCVSEVNGRGLVRLIGAPEETLRSVCEQMCETGAGPVAEADVLVAHTEERQNGLLEIALHLAEAGVNVRYVYSGSQSVGCPLTCVMRVDDIDLAERTIQGLP